VEVKSVQIVQIEQRFTVHVFYYFQLKHFLAVHAGLFLVWGNPINQPAKNFASLTAIDMLAKPPEAIVCYIDFVMHDFRPLFQSIHHKVLLFFIISNLLYT